MTTVGPKNEFGETPKPKARYEISVAVFNRKTNKWEAAKTDIGVKAAKLIKDAGGLTALTKAFGETFALTEKGIYKKTIEGHWVIALTRREMMESFPTVQEILEVISKRLKSPEDAEEKKGDLIERVKEGELKPKIILEIQISNYTGDDLKELAEKLQTRNPQLAEELSEKAETAAGKELEQLVELAHTALYAPRKLKLIGRGKAKEVYKFKGDKRYALIRPVSNVLERISGSKEREIKEEVETAKHIEHNLYKSYLIEILERNGIKDSEKIASAIIEKYATVEELIDALKNFSPAELAKAIDIKQVLAKELLVLKDQISEILKAMKNLSLKMEELTGEERIEGGYTLRMPLATGGNLETEIRKGRLSLTTKFQIISGILHGWANLHRAGYVWGDAKPENILIYIEGDTLVVKLSDFGKTRAIQEGQQLRYTGNGRFMPPEKNLSKKGESYSAALLICRVLEEGFLDSETRMINGEPQNKDKIEPDPKRQGIELFVVMNGALPQAEGTLRGRVRSYGPSILAPSLDPMIAQEEIYGYIDKLTQTIQEEEGISESVMNNLNKLLKENAVSKPSARLDMATFADRFDEIGIELIS